ncbi:MAG: pyridoxamine 5'-phosphate oxidase family protein [Saprospiraceae bacterium]|nr:pyridoxamine 5'-phosphate oxidase family protein [Saprospiraceae bacterium]
MNDLENLYAVLDAGFLCHVAFQHQNKSMIIPTAFGRKDEVIYLHGSTKNFMLNQILDGQTVCVAVTHLDGLVLARSLFDTSVNYRSAVVFGKAEKLESEEERMMGLKTITDHIIKGRWEEVPVGSEQALKATMVVRIPIESASVKIRKGGPMGDEDLKNEVWSGVIPLSLQPMGPVADEKFGGQLPLAESVIWYLSHFNR